MSKGECQREIIRVLTGKKQFMPMSELATRLGVSTRTVNRYVAELTVDYPLETAEGRYGGVKLSDEYTPQKKLLSRKHEDALKRAMQQVDAETAKSLCEILIRFGS